MKIAVAFTLAFLLVCIESATWMTPEQKRRAEQFTSVFENDTTELQYAYCENIHDGRGFTSGRAGFTTGTGDAYVVVKKYTAKKHSNPLAKYLSELKKLAESESENVSHLSGYCNAWKEACKDAEFKHTQDQVVDEMYYTPAMKLGDSAGIKSALARAAFYDTIIQHGEGNDGDSIGALIKLTKSNMHGTPKTGVDEKKWLREFLAVRKHDLQHPHNKDTQKEWAQSVDRVDSLVKILDQGNMDLHPPIHINTKNHKATIN